MAKQFPSIDDAIQRFIERQHIFFTASAAVGARVNISPRSTSDFRVLGPQSVCYLDLTGSGNETAAHLIADGRLTIMLCAFDGPPKILRLYGQGVSHRHDSARFGELLADHFGGYAPLGTRKIVELHIEIVQTSCGYGVPEFDYVGERSVLDDWAEKKGEDGIQAYWREKNVVSMDGLPTGLFD
ncbi:MAG: pyridoxamine 5'-phosphate oxidase family protein [Rhizobiaceae bacterium]